MQYVNFAWGKRVLAQLNSEIRLIKQTVTLRAGVGPLNGHRRTRTPYLDRVVYAQNFRDQWTQIASPTFAVQGGFELF